MDDPRSDQGLEDNDEGMLEPVRRLEKLGKISRSLNRLNFHDMDNPFFRTQSLVENSALVRGTRDGLKCSSLLDQPCEGYGNAMLVMIGTWFVGFKWSFIFGWFELRGVVAMLHTYCAVQAVPIVYLVSRLWRKLAITRQLIMYCSAVFAFNTSLCATGLHVAMGGWVQGVYLPMWSLSTVMFMILYDVPAKLFYPIVAIFAVIYLCDMMVEFRVVDVLPAQLSAFSFGVYHGLRLVFRVEEKQVPQPVWGISAVNNFFTPMILLIWTMCKITDERRQWQSVSDNVLYNLVPPEIADKLRRGIPGSQLTQSHKQVTCFFSDIVGYTQMCESLQDPAKVIAILDRMFGAFDFMAEMTGVYKVETIGDCYFAVATLNNNKISAEESCYRMAIFSLSVSEFMRGSFGQTFQVSVRCGLHTGDLVTGILGSTRPRYVLVGDTVNTASRMETCGSPNAINISQDTAKYLEKYFELSDRGMTTVKGKGEVQMFELGETREPHVKGAFGIDFTPRQLAQVATQRLMETPSNKPRRSPKTARGRHKMFGRLRMKSESDIRWHNMS